MTLRCALVMNSNSFVAGQTPVPQASLTVANDAAAPVNVTGVDLYFTDVVGNVVRPAGSVPLAPIGFGQTTVVPAASSITIGPMGVALGSAASVNSYASVPPQSIPTNSQQLALPAGQQLFLRARVYGSDGSVADASPAQFTVWPSIQPPLGFQGGFAQFADPDNSNLAAAVL